jgi:hypothetical protein
MNSWDKRYSDRVQLLVDILPVLAKEPQFALKGGTAINLFEHDLPRLSVACCWKTSGLMRRVPNLQPETGVGTTGSSGPSRF